MASSSCSNEDPRNIITLRTSDKQLIEVEKSVAMEFATVKAFFEDDPDDSLNVPMTLCDVSQEILDKIITYCKKRIEFRANSTPKEEVKSFDSWFVQQESDDIIMRMTVAANYLEVNDLLNLLEDTVADRIKNKSVEYVRRLFGIVSDFTPEEEAALREEHAWAFEGVDRDD